MSFSHHQDLNADQPAKKRIFVRSIAWVAMSSGLLSLVSLLLLAVSLIRAEGPKVTVEFVAGLIGYIFTMAAGNLTPFTSGHFVALACVILGIFSLILGWNDRKIRRAAIIGILAGVVWFVAVAILFLVYLAAWERF